MKTITINNEEHEKLLSLLTQKNKQEQYVAATSTSQILSQLNISIASLPQKCQQVLQQTAEAQTSMEMDRLDPVAISLYQSREISQNIEEEYEILKLKQKNMELQAKIDRNQRFIEGLRAELACSRESLASETPCPENIQEHIRQLKLKVASYEESCEKAKMKYSKLCVPDAILPASLLALVTSLSTLGERAATLRRRADDAVLARDARQALSTLRR